MKALSDGGSIPPTSTKEKAPCFCTGFFLWLWIGNRTEAMSENNQGVMLLPPYLVTFSNISFCFSLCYVIFIFFKNAETFLPFQTFIWQSEIESLSHCGKRNFRFRAKRKSFEDCARQLNAAYGKE